MSEEKPLTKLIECVGIGIGKLYEPRYIKRMAQARKQEIELISDAISKNIKLPIQYKEGKVLINTTESEQLLQRTANRMLTSELRKQQNIEAVIGEAGNLLELEKVVSAEPLDKDWLYKFFDTVGEVSDSAMQKIWAKILAGEIKQPNTYTLRTLNTLKNITTKEANLFAKLVPLMIFTFEGPSIYNNTELLKKYDISFDDLLSIEDCGLIRINNFVALTTDDKKIFNNEMILIVNKKIELDVYTITESGKQIINLMREDIRFNNKYFLEFCNVVKTENNSVKCNVYKIKSIEKENIIYDETKDLLIN